MVWVRFSNTAEKQIKRLPKVIGIFLQEWVRSIELVGLSETQSLKTYRDHGLKGQRKGQRSASLNYAYRVIYVVMKGKIQIVEVLEVTNHDYRTK